ncbi:murein hydrolase effector protein LrgB [Geothrix limicola]|uniref:Murein hydrolase effector protein LrgB n=1 Tax=Geothrix limicola TaxID=2927978 RepID=A0ABQ5QJ14_9BACT|nr:LrgB family protein [Geothrix limicola]GLH74321.1 murein hydrolase effector protein LrgB [Geothrix limicola]
MSHLLSSLPALFCLLATVGVYLGAKRLYARLGWWWCAPLVLAPLLLILLVALGRIPYATYFADTRWLLWLLGPATVAFGVPIYEYRALIRRHAYSLGAGVIAGVVFGLLTSWGLARLFHLDRELSRSLLTRSVSTPFALAATEQLGGTRDLAALFVVITGVCGMVLGEAVLAFLPLRSRMARGALFGAAAHAAGSAKARELGSEEGVVASLTMILAGVALVLLAPSLSRWLG